MNKELVLKLLAALGVKIGAEEGMIKEDDAFKLVEDLFKAENLGLIQKRDELLGEVVKQKEKIAGLETAAAETGKKQAELEAQLKKANPEEFKAYYEGKAKELEGKFSAELEKANAELEKFRSSHYERIKADEINEALKDVQFIDGLRDGFIALAMAKNQFKPVEPNKDGNITFINQENKTIAAMFREFAISNEGKAFIKNGNQGSGAEGGSGKGGAGQGGQKISRNDFTALSPQAQVDFTNKGGIVTD